MGHSFTSQRDAIEEICRRFGVERLEAFGSALSDEFHPERSDLDFLVRFPPDYDFGPWMSQFQQFEEELTALLQRRVDLVMESALRDPWFRREANKTRRVIYDASQNAKVAAGHS